MQEKDIEKIIEAVKADRMSVAEAVAEVKFLPFTDTGFAKVDHHREVRTGFPEVVYCQGKTAGQVREIIVSLRSGTNKNILATRATHEIFEAVKGAAGEARYHENACLIVLEREKQPAVGNVLVIAAGTSDIAVADEAAVTAGALGSRTETLYDVGIAGAHRLFAHKDQLLRARVIVAVAGMEGALPGLVSGLVSAPVIAVPTSVGYGASFGGLAALLTMLNACPPGLGVVNIDNGFGAGYLAAVINRLGETAPDAVDSAENEDGQR